MNEFEQHLSRQPQRQIPPEWRSEILAAAHEGQTIRQPSVVNRQSWLSTLNHLLSSILWPHPKAWAGLAAVWIFILVLNFSTRDSSPQLAVKSTPPSPEVMVQLQKQQRMFAELVGTHEPVNADRRKIFSPKPRSERVETLTA